jgi:CTP:phosphocholine cytidylyltransferase-like protein
VELEELEWQTHKKAKESLDDEYVISEDSTLEMKMFKRTLQENE